MLVLNISICFQNINRIANSNRYSQFKSKEYSILCHNLKRQLKSMSMSCHVGLVSSKIFEKKISFTGT